MVHLNLNQVFIDFCFVLLKSGTRGGVVFANFARVCAVVVTAASLEPPSSGRAPALGTILQPRLLLYLLTFYYIQRGCSTIRIQYGCRPPG